MKQIDCKFCNRENYSSILCGHRVCNVYAVLVDESQEGYDKQNYQVGEFTNGACEQLKDKIKEEDVVTKSIKRKGKIFESFKNLTAGHSNQTRGNAKFILNNNKYVCLLLH